MNKTVPVVLAVVIITAMLGVNVFLGQAFATSSAAAAASGGSAGGGSGSRR